MKETLLPLEGSQIRKIGKAVWLLHFLISKQTDPNGKVYYGRPISYRWINIALGGELPKRTLQDWMRRLRESGCIETQVDPGRTGSSITILNQKKFAAPGPFAPKKASEILNVDAVQEATGGKPEQRDPNVLRTMRMAEHALRRLQQN